MSSAINCGNCGDIATFYGSLCFLENRNDNWHRKWKTAASGLQSKHCFVGGFNWKLAKLHCWISSLKKNVEGVHEHISQSRGFALYKAEKITDQDGLDLVGSLGACECTQVNTRTQLCLQEVQVGMLWGKRCGNNTGESMLEGVQVKVNKNKR